MNHSSGNIKCYSIWIEGQPDSTIPDRRLGAYVGNSFIDACKRACYDRFGLEQTSSHFSIGKRGIPYYSGCKLYVGRK